MMRHITIAALCSMALIAIDAGASVPSASALEFGVCRNVVANGRYSDVNCTTKAKKRTGAYEWKAGSPAECLALEHGKYTSGKCTKLAKPGKGRFERTDGGMFTNSGSEEPADLEIGSTDIHCASSRTEGEIVNRFAFQQSLDLEGCEVSGTGFKCHSGNLDEGDIFESSAAEELTTVSGSGDFAEFSWLSHEEEPFALWGGVITCNTPVASLYRISGDTLSKGYGANIGGAFVGYEQMTASIEEQFPFTGAFASGEQWNGSNWVFEGEPRFIADFKDAFNAPVELKGGLRLRRAGCASGPGEQTTRPFAGPLNAHWRHY